VVVQEYSVPDDRKTEIKFLEAGNNIFGRWELHFWKTGITFLEDGNNIFGRRE
jgi:hypothetical protein